MRLESLTVDDYRNIVHLELQPDAALTVISGKNGEGKTNLLESIWMLSGAKSFRASKEMEIIRRGTTGGRIIGIIRSEQKDAADQVELTVRMDEATHRVSRTVRKNGVDYGRAANLAGEFPCVVFAPGHIGMVSGPPEGRRRFLDAALCQLYPGYLENLRRYTRALTQKNNALKTAKQSGLPCDEALLDVFDSQMAAYGTLIAEKRNEYLTALAVTANARYDGISDGREQLSLFYAPDVPDAWQPNALTDALRKARSADLKAGFSTVGIHRDDIGFILDGADAKVYSSQGQRRSIVLSVKIAELEMIDAVTGLTPVLLLDDVLSELDDARQDYLLSRIEGKQVFITSCNPELFSGTDGKIVTVQNGSIC